MNQILIRTCNGEYKTGQTVYGAVYVNIVSPTVGCGVRLKFHGFEHFAYGLGSNEEESVPMISDKKDYIDYSGLTLYNNNVPLSLGSYVFPFQFQLSNEIPGTFKASGASDVRWDAQVSYWVEAEMIGAENLKDRQPVVIHQCRPTLVDQSQAEMQEFTVKLLFGLVQKKVFLTAKLQDAIHNCMGFANLQIIVENESKLKVIAVTIKLNRQLVFCTKYLSNIPLAKDRNIMRMDRKILVQPEQDSFTVREITVQDDKGNILNKGMDKIKIPLCTMNGERIPSTTQGAHIRCKYAVHVTARLENGESWSVTVPVNCILPENNQQWQSWQPPSWVLENKATVMQTQSPFCVQQHVLYGAPFAGMPAFKQL